MMRIAQLSRKLNISQTEITGFLKRRKIEGYGGGNSRLTEEHLRLVIDYFRPELLADFFNTEEENDDPGFLSPNPKTASVRKTDQNLPEPEPENAKPVSVPVTEKTEPDPEVKEKAAEEKVEVIRAPKVKLEGLKVVGKIELPEKPAEKKESRPVEKTGQEPGNAGDKIENREKSGRRKNKKVSRSGKIKNGRRRRSGREETYEEKLKRLEREKIKRQKEKEKRLREKKRLHYLKTVKEKQATETKVKKPKKKKEISIAGAPVPEKKYYKNPLRRFWAWLNGEFDNY